MAVQCKERKLLVGNAMSQDDGWAIVERSSVVAKTVNDTVQRCQNGRTGFHEHIEAKMDRTPFRAFVALCLEQVAGINQACLVVSANAYTGVSYPHPLENMLREHFDVGYFCQVTQFAAAHAQVENDLVGDMQVRFNYAPNFVCVAFQPSHQRLGTRTG